MQETRIQVEKENREYATLLLQDYAGKLGALPATLCYAYQQVIQNSEEDPLVESLFSIQKKKMKQLEILGKIIVLLGGNPQYGTMDSRVHSRMIPYTCCGLCYEKDIKKFLKHDIEQEQATKKQYLVHQKLIKDPYIQNILGLLIEEEDEIIKILKNLS